MAILVPDKEQISKLPQKLTQGEEALINTLCKVLDDK